MGESVEVKCPYGHQLVKLFTPPFQDVPLYWCPTCMPEEERKELLEKVRSIVEKLRA
jgi:hypothetical protein